MSSLVSLHEQTVAWVTQNYSNAWHLVKTEEWLLRLAPDASQALILSALTHDMERAFPGLDSPCQDPSAPASDPVYNLAHSERSAKIVATFLREREATVELIDEVAKLIRAHEYGGWPEADLLQAADSLSFLEVNVALFLKWLEHPEKGYTPDKVRDKFDWMYERIQVSEARPLATPLYETALHQLAERIAH
ncbi:MAG TPA: hypothetical protein VFN35_02070 [Ktedonobacteraceae bacterium]|nr:hypothetical protein [Ktedonobacteraceae bacterium]